MRLMKHWSHHLFWLVPGLALVSSSWIYISDSENHRVLRLEK